MNTAKQVDELVTQLAAQGLSKPQIVKAVAEACIGWSYVWGAYGQYCTSANRKTFMDRSAISSGDAELIRKRCQILNGSRSSCTGCKYYPGGQTRIFDCRGFTRWVIQRVGITIQGAGATSQYNTNSNWTAKGLIADMPNVVCCVFKYDKSSGKMEHTGLHVGNGVIIHCSVEVKEGKTTDKGWTHYAIVKGLEGDMPTPTPEKKPTLRRGDRGEYVTLAQTELIQKGYDVGTSGADGIFGRNTETAVKAIQKDNGLVQDGIIGQKTWAVLDAPTPTVQRYTVTVPHLTGADAEKLAAQYPGSTITKEGGATFAD